MITCPWCGTNYMAFQSNCKNCGGSLPLPVEQVSEPSVESLPVPPPPPRLIPNKVLWRILITDGWSIAGLVLSILGFVFGIVGAALTLTLVAAFVGIPFAGTGLLFLAVGIPLLVWRYQMASRIVDVLRLGEATVGEIKHVYQNFHVQVNGRYPWTVEYSFELSDRRYDGKLTTLSRPDLSQQPGKPVYVLHMQGDPAQNTIYPYPYGYFGL